MLKARRQQERAERRLVRARALLVGVEDDAETLGRITSAGREVDVVDDLAYQSPA